MQKIAILYDASQAVLSTFDLDEVLAKILDILRDYFHLGNAAILLLDRQKQEFYVRAQVEWDPAHKQVRIPLGKGMIGNAGKLKRPIYAADVSKDPRYIANNPATRSELAIPLMVREEVVGVLDCQSDKLDAFDQETIDLLTLFSTQASIALQNAELYTLEQRKASQLEAVNAIARQSTAVLELSELMEKVCRVIVQSFDVDQVAILLKEQDRLAVRAHAGNLTPVMPIGSILPPGAGLCGRALLTGKTVVENDVSVVIGYVPGVKETASEMCIPLIAFGETLGVLALDSATVGAFPEEDVPTLESVADMCATAIQNAHYYERVRQMAYLDGLTGIFNRRFFELRMMQEIERANRYQLSLSVIMMDVDHFKRINDEFGHLLGDEVLKQISRLFEQHLRKPDVLCRFGGEEFAVLLPETNGENARAVAEKLRQIVAGFPFPGIPRPVTFSAGVAEFPRHGRTRDELVQAADAALYSSKQSGGDRVQQAPARASV
ncbi:MAG TPA: sensor domain-containing diguanylate cyclase [Terriglobales bacterium]|nr:sensor domain-containing diguanylate cyclase [Terriglobales bacterium]